MCGIFGLIEPCTSLELQMARLREARVCLEHRGPDDFGLRQGQNSPNGSDIGFGQTRLAIIDLSKGGSQPQTTDDGRYTIIFNGEIYNYIELKRDLLGLGVEFKSTSDTEVLLKAWQLWGPSILPKLQGMFAFAVYDSIDATVCCVRDAFGIKPLFYFIDGGRFAFASELAALRVLFGKKPEINTETAVHYLVDGTYDNGRSTFFSGMESLLPGELITIRSGVDGLSTTLTKWWNVAEIQPIEISFQQAADAVRHEFLDGVAKQLRSDVPIGVALSGGVDSSAVSAAIRYLEPGLELNTFSFIDQSSRLSEESWVDLVNTQLGAKPNKVYIQTADLFDDLKDLVATQGEPFGSPSIYAQYRVFEAVGKAGTKVTLEGQGADEMMAGYQGFPEYRLRSFIDRGDLFSAISFIRKWAQWPGRDWRFLSAQYLSSMLPGLLEIPGLRQCVIDLLGKGVSRGSSFVVWDEVLQSSLKSYPMDEQFRGRRLTEALGHALGEKGVTQLLRHSDRNAMRFSVESRVPFLTTNLASLMLSLPEHYLLSDAGETKSIFRAAMRGIVPNQILSRRDKIGFEPSDSDWLGSVLKSGGHDLFEPMLELNFIDIKTVRRLISAAIEGDMDLSWPLWRLINLSVWCDLNLS